MTRTLEKCTAIRHGSSATKDRRWCGFLREGLGLRFVHACSACKLCNLLTTLLMTYLFSFVDLLLLVIIRWFLLPLLPTLKLITSKNNHNHNNNNVLTHEQLRQRQRCRAPELQTCDVGQSNPTPVASGHLCFIHAKPRVITDANIHLPLLVLPRLQAQVFRTACRLSDLQWSTGNSWQGAYPMAHLG